MRPLPGLHHSREEVRELLRLYEMQKNAIRSRLTDFRSVPPGQYFYELAFCLMTPQSSAEHADLVSHSLQSSRFQETGFDPEPFLREPDQYIRFHRTKARHLLKAREEFGAIARSLNDGLEPFALRDWLVEHVKGLGLKESTHFLRNIGKSEGLAILDRHILRNLRRFGVIRAVPQSLTRKRYLRIEKRFHLFAENIGIPAGELDLLFWSMETGEIRK
jgi:N-glycosylase/DNA lyase